MAPKRVGERWGVAGGNAVCVGRGTVAVPVGAGCVAVGVGGSAVGVIVGVKGARVGGATTAAVEKETRVGIDDGGTAGADRVAKVGGGDVSESRITVVAAPVIFSSCEISSDTNSVGVGSGVAAVGVGNGVAAVDVGSGVAAVDVGVDNHLLVSVAGDRIGVCCNTIVCDLNCTTSGTCSAVAWATGAWRMTENPSGSLICTASTNTSNVEMITSASPMNCQVRGIFANSCQIRVRCVRRLGDSIPISVNKAAICAANAAAVGRLRGSLSKVCSSTWRRDWVTCCHTASAFAASWANWAKTRSWYSV